MKTTRQILRSTDVCKLSRLICLLLLSLSGCTLLEAEFPFEGTFVSHETSPVSESWDTLYIKETDRDIYSVKRRGKARFEGRTIPINTTRIYRLDEANYVLTCKGSVLRPDGRDGSLQLGERRFKRITAQ